MTTRSDPNLDARYEAIRDAVYQWDWAEAEELFRAFCADHRAAVPRWFEDEYVFSGMKLWAAGRPRELLRHFATFFERARGAKGLWREEDARILGEAEALL